ncbi:MAG TPA: hypothetical protein PKK26_04385 [Candidatus Wallbacteria bacterium]|nr:hypothetical protein [Candidatus Wallbacteria bacterium]
MKKFNFGLVLILISIILLATPFNFCRAEPDPEEPNAVAKANEKGDAYIATIDIAAVYALHPMMQYYDEKVGLFIKPPKKETTYDDFLKITQARNNDFKKLFEGQASEIKRMKGEIDVLKTEMKRLEYQKAVESAPINETFEAEISKAAKNEDKKKLIIERNNLLGSIQTKYDIEIEKKSKTLSGLLDSYEKIQRSLLKVYYLTPEETAKKFEEITLEIKETIKLAAKKKGVKAVVNSNYFSGKPEKKKTVEKSVEEKTRANSDLEELLKNGPDYSKALGILRTLESGMAKDVVKTRNPEYNETEYVKMLQKMNKDREKEDISKNYHSKDYIAHLDQLIETTLSPVFYGDTDLTWLTVISIMVKNGISKEKAETISEVILDSTSSKNK